MIHRAKYWLSYPVNTVHDLCDDSDRINIILGERVWKCFSNKTPQVFNKSPINDNSNNNLATQILSGDFFLMHIKMGTIMIVTSIIYDYNIHVLFEQNELFLKKQHFNTIYLLTTK